MKVALPEFFMLVNEANAASGAVDDFDLRSGDPASQAEWKRLLAEQRETARNLVRYVETRRDKILAELDALGTEPA